ncbi:hypothetical protein SGCZBJ_12680 [Caulobacter zeae]|uniref:Uncharacterized protein n=1 Tax=Caulobacter zeae TaxID=2055137 RepID=A0A2N5DG90_9CAUL|nr:hypothetical protein [Caulobacter zeae]PLR25084.1 hypothetical protein SGCZBJ_12680 [Caulobacter zeae]
MGVVVQVAGTPAVQRMEDGRVAVWVGTEEDPTVMLIDDVAALTLAQRLVSIVERRPDRPGFAGLVERIVVSAPEQGAPGRLAVDIRDHTATFLLDWEGLAALADAAKAALTSASPEGEA